jgi:hypothetical protein
MAYDFSTIKDPLVQQYLKEKYGAGNKAQLAQEGVDQAQLAGVATSAADSVANAFNQPAILENRMQDLGKAPSTVEGRQQKTDVSGLQKQAQAKLDMARSDEDSAVKTAFEQRKAELAQEIAAKKAEEDAAWRQKEFDQKERGIKAQAASRQAYADSMMGLKRDQLDLQRDKVAADKAKEAAPKPLSAEAALKLANFQNALQAVDEMEKALNSGDNTFTLFGSNDYTLAQDKFAEGYGRGSSGASITKDEREAFKGRTPTWTNDKAEKAAKLRELREDIKMKVKALQGDQQPTEETKVINGATYRKVQGGWQKVK